MACLCVPEGEFDELLVHVPLSTRRKLLLSSTVSFKNQVKSSNSQGLLSLPPCTVGDQVDQHVRKECSPNGKVSVDAFGVATNEHPLDSGAVARCSQYATSFQGVGLPINGNSQGSQADKLKGTEADASGLDKINVGVPLPSNPVPLNVSIIKNVDYADNMLLSLSKDDTNSSTNTGLIAVNTMDKRLSDFTFDELDHIVLKERRKLLLKRKLAELEKPALEGTAVGLAEDLMEYSARRIKQELQPIYGECMTVRNQFNDIPVRSASDLCSCSENGSSSLEYSARRNKEGLQFVDGVSMSVGNEFNDIPNRSASDLQRTFASGIEATRTGNRREESNIIFPSVRTSMEFKSRDGDDYVPASTNNIYNSTLNTSVKVKVEPLDYNNLQNPERSTLGNMVSMKCEEDITHGIDHMLTSVEEFELNSSRNFECLRKTETSAFGFSPIVSESAEPIRVNRPRKRKKTATDSVLTALEEDAPGLLKILLDQGVSVDEIKFYGESQNDDALDESFNEDSFSELEAEMTKLFSQRSSLLRFATVRCTKSSNLVIAWLAYSHLWIRPSICIFMDGQSKGVGAEIFDHLYSSLKDITEYGYATYFFELLDSLPIDWQLKRLVTAMKLTSCGRITLIENKPLSVGEDLTEGEAKALIEFGWMPNTGLGTMLHYCDRVVHDRKNESASSEWRSKIGKAASRWVQWWNYCFNQSRGGCC